MNADIIVIGGGMVGSAIAYGLTRHTREVLLLDDGDRAFRAARGNFGLVWVQSKGDGAPHYTRWSRRSAERWTDFVAKLTGATGVDVDHRQCGGLTLCLTESEFEARRALMERHRRDAGNDGFDYRMLASAELADLVPGIGPDVVGASFTPYDGMANPLYLLRALHAAFAIDGGTYRPGSPVDGVKWDGKNFQVRTGPDLHLAPKLVLAAGLGTRDLAAMIGVDIPMRPDRGQVLVTQRLAPFLNLPILTVRQNAEGSVMLGNSREDVGFDNGTTTSVIADIAARAVTSFPALAEAQVVRAWGALRIMTPDELPIYTQAPDCPGAYAAVCHSGVTLAAVHAGDIADWVAGGPRPQDTTLLDRDRFDVS